LKEEKLREERDMAEIEKLRKNYVRPQVEIKTREQILQKAQEKSPTRKVYSSRTRKDSRASQESWINYYGRDNVFNALRDNIENSNMSWLDKQKAKVKLHDDLYK
jgi:hypothetical protein